MDRVKTLTDKLQEQLAQNAGVDQLLTTVEMLRSELEHAKLIQPKKERAPVAIHFSALAISKIVAEETPKETEPPAKIVEVLQIDEAEVEAELEEIKRTAQEKNNMGAHNKPTLMFDPVEDIPTLTHQQPAAPEPDAQDR